MIAKTKAQAVPGKKKRLKSDYNINPPMTKWIYELSLEDVETELAKLEFRSFVADQIFLWLYKKNIQNVELWSNISRETRETFVKQFDLRLLNQIGIQSGKNTVKMLFELEDKYAIESVMIKEKGHYTFCISSQVGCKLGCAFCGTGRLGFRRNLSQGEIVTQVLMLKKELGNYKGKINLVFMGMGEPLLNYSNLKKALKIISAEKGISLSPRNITISTAGMFKQIKELEKDFPNLKLSFSLNAANEAKRKILMPISRKENLLEILTYFKTHKRKHRITFEYVLLKGVNDSLQDARLLADLLKEIPCKINLIPFNDIPGIDFETPDQKVVAAFEKKLVERGHTVITRWSKGKEIKSACGQLVAGGFDKLQAYKCF